ncbi:MAG: 4-hydroxybenzoate octaprenyltransferase, partial [Kiloniellales bacterium]
VLLLALAAVVADVAWTAYIGLAAVALHFAWQIATLEIDDPANCLARFKSNQIVGWIFFLGLSAGALA